MAPTNDGSLANDAGVTADACARAELLIAAGAGSRLSDDDGGFLGRHLRACAACREAALEPPSGRERGLPEVAPENYAVGAEIGRGGMGRVLSARDLRIGRAVALKEMLASHPDARLRFEREARITARLQHPGIVSVYEVGYWPDGRPFYAMPILNGRTLREAIGAASGLRERLRLLPFLIAATDAVAYAHSRRVVHRDLTPSNILLGTFGETIVIDWGIAKVLDEEDFALDGQGGLNGHTGSPALTAVGTVIGTPAYLAPEQAEGLPVDERADVYALGAILFEVLSGRCPYHGEAAPTVIERLRAHLPPPPPRASEKLPPALVSLVTKAMQPEATARFASATEFVEELRRYQAGERVRVHAYSRREITQRWVSRHFALVVGAAATMALVAAAAIVGSVRVTHERSRVEATTRSLLLEQGRQEALEGRPGRALAYLDEAHRSGESSAALKLLLASVRRSTDAATVLDTLPERPLAQAFSPDGRYLASARQYTTWIHDVAGRRLLKVLKDPKLPLEFVHFTEDGAHLVTWGTPGAPATGAAVWDVRTWTPVRTLAPGRDLMAIDVSRDGRLVIASGADDRGIEIWDIRAGRKLASLAPRFAGERRIGRFSPDGKQVVAYGGNGGVAVWNWQSDQDVLALSGQDSAFAFSANLSPDGRRLVVAGSTGVRLWEVPSGRAVANLGMGKHGYHASFNADGSRILTLGNGQADLFAGDDGALVAPLGLAETNLNLGTAIFSPDGNRVALNRKGAVRIFHAQTGAALETYGDEVEGATYLQFSADGRWLASVYPDNSLQLFDTQLGVLLGALKTPPWPTEVDASGRGVLRGIDATGERVLLGGKDGTLEVRDRKGRLLPASASFADKRLLAVSKDRSAALVMRPEPRHRPEVRSTVTGHVLVTLAETPPGLPAFSLFSPDGAWILLSYADGTTSLWDARSGTRLRVSTFLGFRNPISLAVFSRDGSRLVLREEGAPSYGLWEPRSGRKLATLAIPDAASTAFSPDSQWLIIANDRARVLRASDGRQLYTLDFGDGSSSYGNQIAFAPDSKHFCVLNYNLTILETSSGRMVAKISEAGASAVAFLGDGHLLVTVGREATTVTDWRTQRMLLKLPGNDDNSIDRSIQRPAAASGLDYLARIMEISGKGNVLAVSHGGGGISLWDMTFENRSWQELDQLARSVAPAWSLVDGELERRTIAPSSEGPFGGTYPSAPENLDFEAVEPDEPLAGWQGSEGARIVSHGHAPWRGQRSGLLEVPANKMPGQLIQSFNATAYLNQRLHLRAQMRCAPGADARLFISMYGRSSPMKTVLSADGNPCTGAWEEVEASLEIAPDAAVLTIGVDLNAAGQLWLDDVKIFTQPLERAEP